MYPNVEYIYESQVCIVFALGYAEPFIQQTICVEEGPKYLNLSIVYRSTYLWLSLCLISKHTLQTRERGLVGVLFSLLAPNFSAEP